MLVNRVRSSAQTRGFYCKSKPKVGGWIKDPIGYRVRHGGVKFIGWMSQKKVSFWALNSLSRHGL